jgi:uncharacterized membrane protein YdjX (TVP38/TMEM64 family)
VRRAADSTWLRAGLLVLLLTAGLVLAVTVELPRVGAIRSWVDGAGGAGWTAMVLGLALVLLAPVPRSAVSVLVDVVAGFGPGLAVALAGALIAAVVAFGLGRSLGRSAATRLLGRRLERVDRLMVERGFVALLVGRLLPMVPFVVLSYGAGLTRARLSTYMLATAVGLVPSTVVQVGLGASAGFVVERATALTVVPVVAAVLALAVLAWVAWRRRRIRVPAPSAEPEPVA